MGVVNRVKKQRFHKLLGLVCNFWPQIPLVLCLLAASLEDWQQNCKTLLVNTTTATDQSRAQFAHNCVRALRTPRRTLPHTTAARRARGSRSSTWVNLSNLKKTLKNAVHRVCGLTAAAVAPPVWQHRCCRAPRTTCQGRRRRSDGLRALPQPVRACAQYHSGPWLCCGVTKDFNSDLIQKKRYRHPASKSWHA